MLIYSGTTGALVLTRVGIIPGEGLGSSVAGDFDWDLDGVLDFAAGAPLYDGIFTEGGRLFVWSGQTGALIAFRYGGNVDSRYAEALAGGGDLDGDGFRDLAIASPDFGNSLSNIGRIEVVSGGGPGFVNYCTAGTSASGCAATLSGTGTPSAVLAVPFVLSANGVEGDKRGLFFYGWSGRQANPWGAGSSFNCVVPPVKRTPLQSKSGTPGGCDGQFALDLNAYWQANPNKNPGAGAVAQAQFWHRDPANGSGQPTSLSDALEFVTCP